MHGTALLQVENKRLRAEVEKLRSEKEIEVQMYEDIVEYYARMNLLLEQEIRRIAKSILPTTTNQEGMK